MTPALFLDLDGTLIQTKSGKRFPKDITDWKFIDKTVEVIKLSADQGLPVIIVTNQGGIEKGFMSKEDFQLKIKTIIETLEAQIPNLYIYPFFCAVNDPEDYYRKPNPGMAYKAAIFHQLDLKKSIMIGDASGKPGNHSADDKNFARNGGIGRYVDIEDLTPDKYFFTFLVKRDFLDGKNYKKQKDFLDDAINDT
jgi:DNA 3'-phosphatase